MKSRNVTCSSPIHRARKKPRNGRTGFCADALARLLPTLWLPAAAAVLLPGATAHANPEGDLRNGGFETPRLRGEPMQPFSQLTEPAGWNAPSGKANVAWARPGHPAEEDLPSAPEGAQYAVIEEARSDKPVILQQAVDLNPGDFADTPAFELTFQAGRPNDEPMALASALVILLEPGTDKGKRSVGTDVIRTVEAGKFEKRRLSFNLPGDADVRKDRFFVRFVVRSAPDWTGYENPRGQQRLLIDDVRLRRVYE